MYYGWTIVGVTFVTHFISVGFIFYSYGVFFEALESEFSGSRLGVALGLSIMNLATGLASPFLGRIVDGGSTRTVMTIGAVLLGIGFFLAARMQAMWHFYLLLGSFLGLGAAMLGALSSSTLVAKWFIERRGMALGISTMGVSMSGLIMAPLATKLIEVFGWRETFMFFGVISFVVVVPAVLLLIVERPEDMGLHPDGLARVLIDAEAEAPMIPAAPGGQATDHAPLVYGSTRDTLGDPNFWAISATIGLNFCANGAILTHIIRHGLDLGYNPMQAAYVLSAIAGMGVVGKILFGWITDQIDKRLAFWIAIALQAVGVALILNFTEYRPLLMAGGVFGLGMGGIMPLWGSLLGAAFGRKRFGRVMGLMTPCMLPLQVVGVPFAGYIFDTTGSYTIAFRTYIGVYLAAMIALAFVRLPSEEPGSRPLAPAEASP